MCERVDIYVCVCVRVETVLVVALTAKFDVRARTKCEGRRHCRGSVTEEELLLKGKGKRGRGEGSSFYCLVTSPSQRGRPRTSLDSVTRVKCLPCSDRVFDMEKALGKLLARPKLTGFARKRITRKYRLEEGLPHLWVCLCVCVCVQGAVCTG